MTAIIFSHIIFLLGCAWLFAIPGWFVVRAVLPRQLSSLETFCVSWGSGILLMDLVLLLAHWRSVPFSTALIITAPLMIIVPAIFVVFWRRRKTTYHPTDIVAQPLCMWTYRRIAIMLLLVVLMIGVKTIYLTGSIYPTATDMGHHLYWVQRIITERTIPPYEKQEIRIVDANHVAMQEPTPIADFIIGEHLPLAAIGILLGMPPLSPLPTLFLFFCDIIGVLAVTVLAARLFPHNPDDTPRHDPFWYAATALLLYGVLYTITGAQTKFVSGGVIGNVFGNMFIPMIVLLLAHAWHRRSASFLAYAGWCALGLAYTHHLSAFILLYSLVGILCALLCATLLWDRALLLTWIRIALHPRVLLVFLCGALLVTFVYTPTYLSAETITSATGAPSKATRTGVSFSQLNDTVGTARFALALAGIVFLGHTILRARHQKRIPIGALMVLGWLMMVLVMSLAPHLLHVNILSSRIANYVTIPATLAASYAFVRFLHARTNPPVIAMTLFATMLLFVCADGMADNAHALGSASSPTRAQQTFAVSAYLAPRVADTAWIIKDHNYIAADTWMKLFFLRDYSFPLSRSYFRRYDDPAREQCTRLMISAPQSKAAQQCFSDLAVSYAIVHPDEDAAQFSVDAAFHQIYTSDDITVFERQL